MNAIFKILNFFLFQVDPGPLTVLCAQFAAFLTVLEYKHFRRQGGALKPSFINMCLQ